MMAQKSKQLHKIELRMNVDEIRAINSDSQSMVVSGYVNKTGQPSQILNSGGRQFRETIQKGAFQRAVSSASSDIDFLAEHDNSKILASTKNGSLVLQEDDTGLKMTATIANTTWGQDYYQLIKSGILSNMSFGFRATDEQWDRGSDGIFERQVLDLCLLEVSVVKNPAYLQSEIQTMSNRGLDLVKVVQIPNELLEAEKRDNMNDNESVEELPSDATPEQFISTMNQLIDVVNKCAQCSQQCMDAMKNAPDPEDRSNDDESDGTNDTEQDSKNGTHAPKQENKKDQKSADDQKDDQDKPEDKKDEPKDDSKKKENRAMAQVIEDFMNLTKQE
jgi:HK97 family phage prohead protease